MIKKNKYIIGSLVVVIIFCNYLTQFRIESHTVRTKNNEYSSIICLQKGRPFEKVLDEFQLWKSTRSDIENLSLYRTEKRNWLKFWEWYKYLDGSEYYSLPILPD